MSLMLMRQPVLTSWRKSADESSCSQGCSSEVQLEKGVGGRDGGEGDAERHRAGFPRRLHTCSLNWKELVLHLVVSQLSMVRSVKVTLPSASIRIIVLVLVP